MEKVKFFLQQLMEILLHRHCKHCIHNYIKTETGEYLRVPLCRRNDLKGEKCREGIFPIGFERINGGIYVNTIYNKSKTNM